eukprot:6189005-Pleurochrysis_carterae.AAC.2
MGKGGGSELERNTLKSFAKLRKLPREQVAVRLRHQQLALRRAEKCSRQEHPALTNSTTVAVAAAVASVIDDGRGNGNDSGNSGRGSGGRGSAGGNSGSGMSQGMVVAVPTTVQ